MRCAAEGCRVSTWGGTSYCFPHVFAKGTELARKDRVQLKGQLMDAIKTCSRAERLVVILRGFEGMTRREVGMTLDLSASSIARIERDIVNKIPTWSVLECLGPVYDRLLIAKPNSRIVRAITISDAELLSFVRRDPRRRMFSIRPRDFERIIAEALREEGFVVELTAMTRDGGYDMVAVRSDALGIVTKYIVECKLWAPHRSVGVGVVRQLYGVKEQFFADHAVLVATSYFTGPAKKFATGGRSGMRNLHLRDYDALVDWLKPLS